MRRIALVALPLVLVLGCKTSSSGAAGLDAPKSQISETTAAAAPFATPPVLNGAPDVATLVARVQPAVVNIIVEQSVKTRGAQLPEGFPFDFFGGQRSPRRGGEDGPSFKSQAQGSGFIIDKEGHVVTNAHVVEGVDTVRVKLTDERELKARVRGRDPKLDIAVLQIEGGAKDFPAAALGSSEAVRVGEYVVAMGNPMGLGHTVTMGIVSAKSRTIGAGPYDDFIQTDASINPGNSGGPLFNLKGEVIAINTAILNPQRAQNIGFAIPVDALKEVLPQLLAKGTVSRGRLGVVIQPVDAALAKALGVERSRGALVGDLERGGPADRVGIRSGDVIVSVNGTEVHHSQELPRIVARHAPGTKVDVKVLRDKQPLSFGVTLDELKDSTNPATQETESNRSPATPSSALGVNIDDAPGGAGAVVRNVAPGGRAEGALQAGDVIVEVNRTKVLNAADLAQKMQATNGGPILLKVQRQGHTRFVAIER